MAGEYGWLNAAGKVDGGKGPYSYKEYCKEMLSGKFYWLRKTEIVSKK